MPRKYHPGTIDNAQVIRRINQRTARRLNNALTSEGTRPFQSVEKLTQQQADLQALVGSALSVVADESAVEGFGPPSSEWGDLCAVRVSVPAGRSVSAVQATGTATMTAKSTSVETGCVLRLLVDGRQVASGVMSRESAESDQWDGLVSGVINLNNLKPGDVISVVLQYRAATPADWPKQESNTADLTVQAAFPVVSTTREGGA
ncbi:hypothetical protein [Bifidobacterium scardovii]|uniref:Uncharacterized protein n=2 Tax=Bifidobacterium scardovii TaxID=158787 RepID=A0A087DI26_9BIFI|nr:hypothetical protein [Bifidobacterium scardovii]KFI95176.1 hypothetical protein BSCA_0994 [Bifidobacterium scardovii]MDK6348744.1 hypothetical protein [Bifidobacterium scardovii]MDU8981279.1 hypothetical protein [Bifidobacterium scardovii]BAQ31564.1 hypothetical protein BBSC_1484 [Bifidobacterium scardovii JCM 12489 = DSM 13734]